ncbi:2Fe-2S iron-sulfur cluster-binding protein [Glacieibacterium megasporae]|uniref:2Fe-2S iron-sulfur cluster-binding protein n=1 Tax=Glacieibacterium megasporae TaxID=2835787 RepID=UPI001C1E7C79|nr:2Fe-2S iron-sulfur cluster-binding protein [Polymorphobacter megasporae]UAJ08656.1 2Fe-2S iron-sulfur cluster binding domain-containing protein [Polymorphobacter megasporae]
MTLVRFVSADGKRVVEITAPAGTRLLDLAQNNDQPLEGACEGAMACSTCHVLIKPEDFDRLPKATAEEEDMLDFAYGASRTSRLACQIWLTDDLATLEVKMPAASHDMTGR